jgi:hypothetical protein
MGSCTAGRVRSQPYLAEPARLRPLGFGEAAFAHFAMMDWGMACLAEAREAETARLRPLGFGEAAFAHFAMMDWGVACLAVAREASEGWWCAQSDTNRSPLAIPLVTGKFTGNFAISRLLEIGS